MQDKDKDAFIFVCFVDFDGVLNSMDSEEECYGRTPLHSISSRHVGPLNRIAKATPEMRIVISSTWRILHPMRSLKQVLKHYGLEDDIVIGKTDEHDSDFVPPGSEDDVGRHTLIRKWLKDNKTLGIKDYAILDDYHDACIEGHFFQTTYTHGLTDEIADRVIQHFQEAQ